MIDIDCLGFGQFSIFKKGVVKVGDFLDFGQFNLLANWHGDFGNLRKPLSIGLLAKKALYELACPLMSIANGGRPLCNLMIND